jgi:hypothetical protein
MLFNARIRIEAKSQQGKAKHGSPFVVREVVVQKMEKNTSQSLHYLKLLDDMVIGLLGHGHGYRAGQIGSSKPGPRAERINVNVNGHNGLTCWFNRWRTRTLSQRLRYRDSLES